MENPKLYCRLKGRGGQLLDTLVAYAYTKETVTQLLQRHHDLPNYAMEAFLFFYLLLKPNNKSILVFSRVAKQDIIKTSLVKSAIHIDDSCTSMAIVVDQGSSTDPSFVLVVVDTKQSTMTFYDPEVRQRKQDKQSDIHENFGMKCEDKRRIIMLVFEFLKTRTKGTLVSSSDKKGLRERTVQRNGEAKKKMYAHMVVTDGTHFHAEDYCEIPVSGETTCMHIIFLLYGNDIYGLSLCDYSRHCAYILASVITFILSSKAETWLASGTHGYMVFKAIQSVIKSDFILEKQ